MTQHPVTILTHYHPYTYNSLDSYLHILRRQTILENLPSTLRMQVFDTSPTHHALTTLPIIYEQKHFFTAFISILHLINVPYRLSYIRHNVSLQPAHRYGTSKTTFLYSTPTALLYNQHIQKCLKALITFQHSQMPLNSYLDTFIIHKHLFTTRP